MSNLEKYNEVFISCFLVTEDQLPNLSYQLVSVWDSVGHMALIAAIEESFEISVQPEDIFTFRSYENGKEMLKKYNIDI
jgi:acyl carrier protein